MAADGTLQRHWPVPMAVHHFAQAAQVNPVLANAFRAIRAADQKAPPGVLYASADDLLRRVELPEFHALVKFIVASVHATAQDANAGVWPPGRHGLELELMGVWFQIQTAARSTMCTRTAIVPGQVSTTCNSTTPTSGPRILSLAR